MIGGFSRAVDLIQSEYGWLDEVVLELPVCRLRQIVANIEARLKAKRLYTNAITEWQTRTISQFIAGTVPVEKGKTNTLAKEAEKIRLRIEDDEGQADNDAPPEVYVEQGSQIAENAAGSFEQLMGGFRAR